MSRELVIYSDESISKGSRFSDFYGGLLVESTHLQRVIDDLESCRENLGLRSEVKWAKIDATNVERYAALMDSLFLHIFEGRVKIRVMFTQNSRMHDRIAPVRSLETYFKLYYQFVKHTFGLRYAGREGARTRVRLLLDQLPDSGEQASQFRGYISALSHWSAFRNAGILIDPKQIAEVRSHEHVLLQCLDVVIGAMQFRLNNKHLAKPTGSLRRGKRTVAKEAVYKTIHGQLVSLRPYFNIGITTGCDGDVRNRWLHPYRHWLFLPRRRGADDE